MGLALTILENRWICDSSSSMAVWASVCRFLFLPLIPSVDILLFLFLPFLSPPSPAPSSLFPFYFPLSPFNTLSRFVIAFLPRSSRLLISWFQSLSTVILEPKKVMSVTVSIFSPSICHEVMKLIPDTKKVSGDHWGKGVPGA